MKRLLPFLFVSLWGDTIDLNEAIKYTLKNHPDIKTFILNIQKSDIETKSAKSDYLPKISIDGVYNFTQTYTINSPTGFKTTNSNGYNIGINLKQKLWDFKSTIYKIESTKFDKDISKLNLKELKSLLAYKIKTLYKLAITQKKAIEVYKENLKLKEEYYKQALSLYKQGLKTKVDADRFLVNVYTAKSNLKNSIKDYKKTLKILSLYTTKNVEDIKNISFEEEIPKDILKHNYSLQIDKLNIQKNKTLHKSIKNSKYGNIDLVANYSKIDALNSYDSKSIGIYISIPLYSPQIDSEIEKVKLTSLIQTSQLNSKMLSLKEDIENSLNEIYKQTTLINTKQKELKVLKELRILTSGRYKEGVATYLEVIESEQAILNASLELLESEYKKSIEIDKLKYLKGEL